MVMKVMKGEEGKEKGRFGMVNGDEWNRRGRRERKGEVWYGE